MRWSSVVTLAIKLADRGEVNYKDVCAALNIPTDVVAAPWLHSAFISVNPSSSALPLNALLSAVSGASTEVTATRN